MCMMLNLCTRACACAHTHTQNLLCKILLHPSLGWDHPCICVDAFPCSQIFSCEYKPSSRSLKHNYGAAMSSEIIGMTGSALPSGKRGYRLGRAAGRGVVRENDTPLSEEQHTSLGEAPLRAWRPLWVNSRLAVAFVQSPGGASMSDADMTGKTSRLAATSVRLPRGHRVPSQTLCPRRSGW